jgi:hypothetical protein
MTAQLRVEVDDSPVYEVLLGLFAFSRPAEFAAGDAEAPSMRTMQAVPSGRLKRVIALLGAGDCPWDQLLGFASQMPRPRSVARFLDELEEADAVEVLSHMLGFYAERFPEHVRAAIADAADGSRTAREVVTQTLGRGDPQREALTRQLLSMPPAQVQALTVEAVRRWHGEVFARDEPAVAPLLAGDASAKRALLTSSPELIIRIATGIRYVPKPWIEGVLLIPTVVLRPWVIATNYRRLRIYCYAITEDGSDRPLSPMVHTYRRWPTSPACASSKAWPPPRSPSNSSAGSSANPKPPSVRTSRPCGRLAWWESPVATRLCMSCATTCSARSDNRSRRTWTKP